MLNTWIQLDTRVNYCFFPYLNKKKTHDLDEKESVLESWNRFRLDYLFLYDFSYRILFFSL